METKTSTESGLKFKGTGVHNTDNGKVLGVLESEYNCKDYGKWSHRLNSGSSLDEYLLVERVLTDIEVWTEM